MNHPALFDETPNNASFLLRKIFINLESERIVAALYAGIAYAHATGDSAREESFKNIIKDDALCRRIGWLDAIKMNPDTAIEYYEKDLDNDPYKYDVVTEKTVRVIKMLILEFLGEHLNDETGININELITKLNE